MTEIIENMKYAIAADDAFIFLRNDTDGHLYMHENKESSTSQDCVIGATAASSGNCPKRSCPRKSLPGPVKRTRRTRFCVSDKGGYSLPRAYRRQLLGIWHCVSAKRQRSALKKRPSLKRLPIPSVTFSSRIRSLPSGSNASNSSLFRIFRPLSCMISRTDGHAFACGWKCGKEHE